MSVPLNLPNTLGAIRMFLLGLIVDAGPLFVLPQIQHDRCRGLILCELLGDLEVILPCLNWKVYNVFYAVWASSILTALPSARMTW